MHFVQVVLQPWLGDWYWRRDHHQKRASIEIMTTLYDNTIVTVMMSNCYDIEGAGF